MPANEISSTKIGAVNRPGRRLRHRHEGQRAEIAEHRAATSRLRTATARACTGRSRRPRATPRNRISGSAISDRTRWNCQTPVSPASGSTRLSLSPITAIAATTSAAAASGRVLASGAVMRILISPFPNRATAVSFAGLESRDFREDGHMGWMADETGLDKCRANYVPLTPLSHLNRAARVFPDREALVYGNRRWTYAELPRPCQPAGLGAAAAGRRPPATWSRRCCPTSRPRPRRISACRPGRAC